MGIIKRILLLLFGLLSGLFGFISIFTSFVFVIMSFTEGFRDIDDPGGRLMMNLWTSVVCELFLVFGITASLLGLYCVFGPKDWIKRVMKYFWSKAMKVAFIVPISIWIFLAIGLLWNYLVS